MNKIHIYIDESGDLTPISDGGKTIFMMGCVITDDPITLNVKINKLKNEILNGSYFFGRNRENFIKEGFHASTNHPDIYGKFVSILNTLNFRCYFILIDKSKAKFDEIIKREKDIYYFLFKKLIIHRLLNFKDKNIHIVLEQSTTKRTIEKRVVSIAIEEINQTLLDEGLIPIPINITYDIQGKNEDAGVDVVDYVNHIIYTAKTGNKEGKKYPGQIENLKFIEPKIALISDLINKRYFEGRKEKSSLLDFLNYI